MPTGVPIRDIESQLFEAAERVLVRDGPDALTSRAVTGEVGVAKGVLHRHFADFDTFLAALVLTHLDRIDARSKEFRASAGSGTVTGNLARALADALNPVVVGIIALVCSRPALLVKLRLTTPAGIPVATETTKMITAYLTAERGLGRIPLKVDVDALAVMLVGGAHLLAAGQDGRALAHDEVRDLISAAIDDMTEDRPRART